VKSRPSEERDQRLADDSVEWRRALAAQEVLHRRHTDDLHAQLEAMRSSLPWRAATAVYSWLDQLAPPTTRRRSAYVAVVRRVKPGRRRTSVSRSDASPSGTAALASIRIPTPTDPFVSIVIPVGGSADATARCLAALAADRPTTPYEVILLDDGSSDDRVQLLKLVDNVRVVAHEGGGSSIAACRRGLAAAGGELVALLSSDTEVRPGWLDAMVSAVRVDERVGVVGAQLLRPDGSIREAGGIVWSDGSTSSYGRGDDPSRPEYSYVREVDYCSSSCLLVRRDLLAGLLVDPRVRPDLAADLGLAFAARSLGYRVVYQPAAVVLDHARRTGSGLAADPERTGFVETWRTEVTAQHPPDPSRLLLARDRRGPRALVVDQCVPAHDQDAGSLRMYSLLSLLADLGFAVTFLPDNGVRTEPHTTSLQQRGVEVLYGDADLAAHLAGLSADLTVCILSRPHVARRYLRLVREHAPGTPVVYDTVDLHFLREQRRARLRSHVREGPAVGSAPPELELELARATDATIAISWAEREVLEQALPGARVFVVPTVHEPRPSNQRPFDERRDLLFVGSFEHPPNVDAVVFFVRDVLPLVRERLPSVRLTVVGRKPPPVVRRLAGDAVDVVGWVPELAGLYERHRVSVAPLRYGAGLKGKVGESLSWGLPLVTTAVGAEGFGAEHGRHLLIGESPGELAHEVVRLYTDRVLWEHLAREGRGLVGEGHSLIAVRGRLVEVLGALGVQGVSSST
jgi:GT2 family glycosyltransferase/glycosyltransferase involved in cell wall biosynthesis